MCGKFKHVYDSFYTNTVNFPFSQLASRASDGVVGSYPILARDVASLQITFTSLILSSILKINK